MSMCLHRSITALCAVFNSEAWATLEVPIRGEHIGRIMLSMSDK